MPSLPFPVSELADFHLATSAVLAAALATTGLIWQPVRRLPVAGAAAVGVVVVLLLALVPGWSIVPLGEPIPATTPISTVQSWGPPTPDNAIEGKVAPPPRPPLDGGFATPVQQVPPPTLAKRLSAASYGVICFGSIVGSVASIVWLMWGSIAAQRIVAQAKPASDDANRLLAELAGPLTGPLVGPRLLVTDQIGTAAAIGLRPPTILLPERLVASGTAGDLRTVLAHELAHVRNGDLWLLAALRLLMVVLWPNPLYWALRRRVRLDQETLADAAAADLSDRHAYAERLVQWARDLSAPPRLAGAAGIWEGRSQLRRRVATLVDERFAVLRRSSRFWRVTTTLLGLWLAMGVSLVTLAPAEENAPSPLAEVEGQSASAVSAATDTATPNGRVMRRGIALDAFAPVATGFAAEFPREANVVAGRCLDAADEPIAGVEVLLLHRESISGPTKEVARVKTGPYGGFRFEDVVADPDSVEFEPMAPVEELYHVVVRRARLASQAIAIPPFQIAQRGSSVMCKLQRAATLAGRVADSKGVPVEGARVAVTIDGSIDLGDQTMHAALTDADGRYAISDLPPRDFAAESRRQELEHERMLQGGEGATAVFFSMGVAEVTVTHPQHALCKKPVERVPGELDVELAPPAMVEGRLVHDEGKSLKDLLVQIGPDPLSKHAKEAAWFTLTSPVDATGRYRFESLPAGDYHLQATAPYRRKIVNVSGQNVKAIVGGTATAPDLVVSEGRVVRFQLVNGKTKEPLTFDAPITVIGWYFLAGENRYGGSLTRRTEVSREGQFKFRIDNRAVRMGLELHLPFTDSSEAYPQFRVEVPAGDVEQPFLFPIDLEDVIGKRPRSATTLEAASRLASEGKLDEAIERLTQSLEGQKPKDPRLLLLRADLLARVKRHKEAIADYEAAIDQETEFGFALKNNLAYLLATVEDPQIRDAQRSVQLAREAVAEARLEVSAQAYDTLATALEAAGDPPAAVAALEKAITSSSEVQKPDLEEKLKKLRERVATLSE
ncbi:MAG: M56 family metallopeptidase [Lacipirellulaceae bacterium]